MRGAFIRNAVRVTISPGESQPEQYKCLEGIENAYVYKRILSLRVIHVKD